MEPSTPLLHAGLCQKLNCPVAAQAKRIDDQAKRIAELEKRNPTQRLDEAYSVKAEEERREDARQDGKPEKKKQKSTRRGRISTAEKLAAATHEENIWPGEHLLSDCRWRYSRVAWRIIDG